MFMQGKNITRKPLQNCIHRTSCTEKTDQKPNSESEYVKYKIKYVKYIIVLKAIFLFS